MQNFFERDSAFYWGARLGYAVYILRIQNGRYYAGMIKSPARRTQTSRRSAPISSSRSLDHHLYKLRAPLSDILSVAFSH